MKRKIHLPRAAALAGAALFLTSCQYPVGTAGNPGGGNNAWGYNGYGNYGQYGSDGTAAAGTQGTQPAQPANGGYYDPNQQSGGYYDPNAQTQQQGGYYPQQPAQQSGGYYDPNAQVQAPVTNYPSDYNNAYNQPAIQQPAPAPNYTARTYTVQRGDTLYGISRRYNVTVSGLRGANGISGDIIQPGQVLNIP